MVIIKTNDFDEFKNNVDMLLASIEEKLNSEEWALIELMINTINELQETIEYKE